MSAKDVLNKKEQGTKVSELFDDLRVDIVNVTSGIATKVPQHKAPDVEQFQNTLLDVVSDYADKLTPENLYDPISPASIENPSDTLKLISLINEYKKYLIRAHQSYAEESTREIEMTLFKNIIFEFDYISVANSNFRDAITAIKTALFATNTVPFKNDQITELIKIMDILKNNINLPDSVLDNILDILDANFNLPGPLAGMKIVE